MELLEAPESPDDLYLETGDVSWSRPVFQGDIYREVHLLGVSEGPTSVMLITHPCSMRQGESLRERLAGVHVVEYQKLPLPRWRSGHYDVMPLPGSVADALDMNHPAADFRYIGGTPTSELILNKRVAALSENGLLLMQQRYIHHHARYAVDIETLYEHMAPVLIEAELQTDWSDSARLCPQAGVDALAIIEQSQRDFQTFLGRGESSLREQLKTPRFRAAVRREVRREIEKRFGE